MANNSPVPDNPIGFLICPCTGDKPFTVGAGEQAYNFLQTEEYYAVDLAKMCLVDETGTYSELEHKE